MADVIKKQVGVIPFSVNSAGKLNFILITPKYCDNYWIFPKGNIEKDLGKKKSALEEGLEEAGIKGKITELSPVKYEFCKARTDYIVELYIMKVSKILDSWEEMEDRQRIIVKKGKVLKLISDKSLLKAFNQALKSIGNLLDGKQK